MKLEWEVGIIWRMEISLLKRKVIDELNSKTRSCNFSFYGGKRVFVFRGMMPTEKYFVGP